MRATDTTPAPDAAPDWRAIASVRRTLLALTVLAQTAIATYFMLAVLPYHGATLVETGMAILFAVLFAWISVGFWIGVLGFVYRRAGGDPHSLLRQYSDRTLAEAPMARTAIVMPIYHEPVETSLGRIRAIYRDLERNGQRSHFDFYILSDSRDPDVWLREQAAWATLCDELGAQGRLFYRRRVLNLNLKSGNVGDFLRRWGGYYEYMVVLDADSLISGNTLVRMVRLMQCRPQAGILQTSPTLLNGQSLFARVQQMANRLYGPLFTTGLASIQLGDAAFWGHNAIIRVPAFMAHCGLRKLPGHGLFRGPVMSHDFVEAAYMGRAGYEVWLEPELGESYEESPPSLVDELTRDKRWAKGNMQHFWIMLRGRRLRFGHRMAFLNGIMAYLASPLWLGFLILTTIETTRLTLWPINYFPDPHRLTPLWPEWHPEWAFSLLGTSLALLFLPKILAVIDVLLKRRARAFGGTGKLVGSTVLEMVLSALLAPIRMLAHSRFVLEALLNVSLKWAGQNRSSEIGWKTALLSQAPGTILALAWSSFALWLDPLFFLWSLPVALPLVLAAPTSVFLSRTGLGDRMRRNGWLLIPEETQGSPLREALPQGTLVSRERAAVPAFQEAIIHPWYNQLHRQLARPNQGPLQRAHLEALADRCLADGPDALTRAEKTRLARDARSLAVLHREVWRQPGDSPWGRLLDDWIDSAAGDDPYRVNDAREVTQEGQQYIDPELEPDADLQENAQWGQQQ